jgi:Ca2+-binding EF-hand superfamily protein
MRNTNTNVPLFLSFFFQAMKAFIEANFKMIDLNGDGVINAEEFRYNCITRIAVDEIKIVDDSFNTLLNVSTHPYA